MTHDLNVEQRVLREFLTQHRWARAALTVKLEDLEPDAVTDALIGLLIEGLLIRDGAEQWVLAPAVRHLTVLGMLAPPNGAPDAGTLDRILAREALQKFARREEADRDAQDLPPLIERATAAGLGLETIAALAEGRRGAEH